MNIKDIKEGKTFYHLRITRGGQIYKLNKVNIDSIMGNIKCVFQIRYTIHNSDASYKTIYKKLYVEESNSPYFIKMGIEEYITLPNKQALMKAIKAQIMRHSFLFYPQLGPIAKFNYKSAMRLIKQLH